MWRKDADDMLTVLRTLERFALVAIFLLMVAMYFANVLIREFGGTLASDFGWIEEAVRTLNIYLVFLAAGLALEKGRQVGVHTWREAIAERTHLPIRKVIDAVGFLVSLYLVWLGYEMTQFVVGTGQRSPTLDISAAWIYVAPTLGFSLLALRYLLSLLGAFDRFAAQTADET